MSVKHDRFLLVMPYTKANLIQILDIARVNLIALNNLR